MSKVVKLRARWVGPPPRTGDYLMAQVRPRHAYRITEVTNSSSVVNWDPVAKAESRKLLIVADRVAVDAVSEHARIHAWKWDKREARSKWSPKREASR